jgi:predicted SnoaL-like aldol condensation-catalyzing enzyme
VIGAYYQSPINFHTPLINIRYNKKECFNPFPERLVVVLFNDAGSLSLREKAVSFLELVANGNVREAYQNFVGAEFRHHNPYFGGDAETLLIAMEENAASNPNKVFEVKRTIAEGDFVWVHSHVKQNQNDLGATLVHIFRFDGNLIVELWDIGMPIPGDSPNENGVF